MSDEPLTTEDVLATQGDKVHSIDETTTAGDEQAIEADAETSEQESDANKQ